MKSRRRHATFCEEGPFPCELLVCMNSNGDEIFNFTGEMGGERQDNEITAFLQARSFAGGRETMSVRSSYLQFEQADGRESAAGTNSFLTNESFARVEDASHHVWFISQRGEDVGPFARNFTTVEQFLHYAQQHSITFPTTPPRTGTSPATTAPTSPDVVAKWLDIQTTDKKFLKNFLSLFFLANDTLEHCCDMDPIDRLIAHSSLGYFFFNLMCTPITPDDESSRGRHPKSVMQRRLDAAMADQPRCTASPVPVAIIVFSEWIITVHREPFYELGALFKFLHINCSDHSALSAGKRSRVQLMTSSFIFSSFFQILVGYQMDSVSLTTTLGPVGDYIFDVEGTREQQDKVTQRMANVRRCLGECLAELGRREDIVSTLLQPHMMHSFLTRKKVCRRQLEGARAYLLRLSDEVGDSHDTVSVAGRYHNATLTENLLYHNQRSLRQTLLFTKLTNIMYPFIALQTIYSMNIPLPFSSEGGPLPTKNLNVFFVMLAIMLLLLALCVKVLCPLFSPRQ